ncbi:MAG: HEAT repeat domain-containing protein [Ktedonobacteraceae bacterium]|nr:HEAT repeat domain-containing protein [Ktedonobacteraceae bacterium]
MNEHENHQSRPSGDQAAQAPLSLLPALLARLNLDEPAKTRGTSLEGLRKALADPEWTARAAAVQELAQMSDPQSFELLLSMLHDEDVSVRAGVVCVLGKRGDPQDQHMLAYLEAALHDHEWHVRETAVYALSMLGRSASISAISELVRDSDEDVRRAVIEGSRHLQRETLEEADGNILGVPERGDQLPGIPGGTRQQWIHRSFARLVPRSYLQSEREATMREEKQAVTYEDGADDDTRARITGKHVPGHRARSQRPWLKILEQAVAVLLVLGIIIGWFAISRLPRSSPNTSGTHSLGAPIITIRGSASSASSSQKWSADGRTFSYIQVDTQKNVLKVQMVDLVSKRSTSYPVLDSSWVVSSSKYNNLQLLMDHYLLAIRPQGKNLATMEIWDITAHRPITVQTVLAYKRGFPVPSADQQRVAGFSPDGKITIWDVASGRKLVTCENEAPDNATEILPLIQWYDHDQHLLFFNANNRIEAWTTATGARLFARQYGSRMFLDPLISPDNKYIARFAGAAVATIEILDAHSGQTVRTYDQHTPGGTATSIQWQSNSIYFVIYLHSYSSPSNTQMRIQNIFTGQIELTIPSSQNGTFWSSDMFWSTDDGHYAVIVKNDRRTMDIWHMSSGTSRHIATVTTPGMQIDPSAIFAISNRYIIVGEKNRFGIWDIATGKLLYPYRGFTPFTINSHGASEVSWSPNGKYLLMGAWKSAGPGDVIISIWRMP